MWTQAGSGVHSLAREAEQEVPEGEKEREREGDEDLLKSDARTLSDTLREEAEFSFSSGSSSGQSSGSDSCVEEQQHTFHSPGSQ